MRKIILFSCLSIIFLTNTLLSNENIVYGHGFPCQCSSIDFRIEDQVFLKDTLQKNESNIIMGKIVNLLDVNQEVAIGILLYEDTFVQRVSYEVNKILKIGSSSIGLSYNGNPEFYFDIKPSFTQKIILQPNDTQDYEIEITPLKSGTYHIHSAVYMDDKYRATSGQTITVLGDFNLSEQELFKFYIPFYFSVMLVLIGLGLGVLIVGKKKKSSLIQFLNLVQKPFLKISKRKALECGIFLVMIGVLLLGSSLTLLLEQRCDNLYPGHNLCGVNPMTDKIISILFLIFGILFLLGGILWFIFGMKKKNPARLVNLSSE